MSSRTVNGREVDDVMWIHGEHTTHPHYHEDGIQGHEHERDEDHFATKGDIKRMVQALDDLKGAVSTLGSGVDALIAKLADATDNSVASADVEDIATQLLAIAQKLADAVGVVPPVVDPGTAPLQGT